MVSIKSCLCAVAFLAATTVQAATITFDSATSGNFIAAPYSESGFGMTLDSGHYDIFPGGTGGSNHVNIDTVRLGPAKITFAQTGGEPFDLLNFDVIDAGNGLLTSSKGGSVTLSNLGVLNLSGPAWTGIGSFSLATTSDAFVGIDTINVTAVPEPKTYAMMLAGILAVAGFARYRRS